MSDVATINAELVKFSQRLARAVNEYDVACKDAAEKRTDYDVQWAKTLLKSQLKTVSARNSEAVVIVNLRCVTHE